MSDGFAMELCGTQSAYQIVPEGIDSIDLDRVGTAIEGELRGRCSFPLVLDLHRAVRPHPVSEREIDGAHRRQRPRSRSGQTACRALGSSVKA